MTSSNLNQSSYEEKIGELFNKTIIAKKIAIDTVVQELNLANDYEEIARVSNNLLEQFRQEFKATIDSLIQQERLRAKIEEAKHKYVNGY